MSRMKLIQQREYWYIQISRGKKVSLKTKNKADAERIFKKYEREYLEGRLIHLDRKSNKLMSAFMAEFLESRKGSSKSTVKGLRLALEHFVEFFGDRQVSSITVQILDEYRGYLRAKYPMTNTVNAYIRDFKTALKTAQAWGLIKHTSLDRFKKYKIDMRKPIYMTSDEVKRLLVAAQSDTVMRTAIPLMIYGGIARAEILGPIYINDKVIQYKRQKTGITVTVPITAELRPYIAHLTPGIQRIVPWKNPRTLSRKFEAAVKSAGLIGISTHKVRHTFATILIEAGVDIGHISKLMGHASVDVTMKFYAHLMVDELKKAMDKFKL